MNQIPKYLAYREPYWNLYQIPLLLYINDNATAIKDAKIISNPVIKDMCRCYGMDPEITIKDNHCTINITLSI